MQLDQRASGAGRRMGVVAERVAVTPRRKPGRIADPDERSWALTPLAHRNLVSFVGKYRGRLEREPGADPRSALGGPAFSGGRGRTRT
jgi:hypothetical protein